MKRGTYVFIHSYTSLTFSSFLFVLFFLTFLWFIETTFCFQKCFPFILIFFLEFYLDFLNVRCFYHYDWLYKLRLWSLICFCFEWLVDVICTLIGGIKPPNGSRAWQCLQLTTTLGDGSNLISHMQVCNRYGTLTFIGLYFQSISAANSLTHCWYFQSVQTRLVLVLTHSLLWWFMIYELMKGEITHMKWFTKDTHLHLFLELLIQLSSATRSSCCPSCLDSGLSSDLPQSSVLVPVGPCCCTSLFSMLHFICSWVFALVWRFGCSKCKKQRVTAPLKILFQSVQALVSSFTGRLALLSPFCVCGSSLAK